MDGAQPCSASEPFGKSEVGSRKDDVEERNWGESHVKLHDKGLFQNKVLNKLGFFTPQYHMGLVIRVLPRFHGRL